MDQLTMMNFMAAAAQDVAPVLNVAELFSADIYTGNGNARDIVNGLDLLGDGGLVWLKNREDADSHLLFDTVRGALNRLASDSTAAGDSLGGSLTSFNADGFSLGTGTDANFNNDDYAAWSFKKAARFFDVVSFTGTGVARTIAHSLGAAPGKIIVKNLGTGSWYVYHRGVAADAQTDYLLLDTNAAAVDLDTIWNDTAPTTTEFTVGSGATNTNGASYIAYLFAHDTASGGVIQCGSYTGNGSTTGPTIDLGWEPQYVEIKRVNSAESWWLYDSARDAANPRTAKLKADLPDAEDVAGEDVDFTATGFQPKTTAAGINANGSTYVYMAIRKEDA